MSYLIDTDILIYWLNNTYPSIQNQIGKVDVDKILTCAITVAELYYGAYNSSRVSENLKLIEELTSSIEILPFDDKYSITRS